MCNEANLGDLNGFNIYGEMRVLEPALQIAMNGLHKYRVKGWSLDQDRLVLHWGDHDPRVTALFAPLDIHATELMIKSWLIGRDYGEAPRTDGSTGKGIHIYNERWGQIEGHGSYSFIAIEPHWVIYGK